MESQDNHEHSINQTMHSLITQEMHQNKNKRHHKQNHKQMNKDSEKSLNSSGYPNRKNVITNKYQNFYRNKRKNKHNTCTQTEHIYESVKNGENVIKNEENAINNLKDAENKRRGHDPTEVHLLFSTRHKQNNQDITIYDDIKVDIVPKNISPICSFDDLPIDNTLRDNIELCGYKCPTPIQKYSIPVILSGKDILACAQTGSGKTAAFLIPVINSILINGLYASTKKYAYPNAVILTPTRELSAQIYDEGRKFSYKTNVRLSALYGGIKITEQLEKLKEGCDIVVATPGRLLDVYQRRQISFSEVKFLILDEADRMLELGFEEQMDNIINSNKTNMPSIEHRQSLLFSATFPRVIQALAQRFMKTKSYLLTVGRVGSTTKKLCQTVHYVPNNEKSKMLMEILYEQIMTDLILIFVKTKIDANLLHKIIIKNGIPCTIIHGNRKQNERESALSSFKSGENPVMIATDVASRGLDIPNVQHVIQYDLPMTLEDYIHRIGRTARAGNTGNAISFYNESNSSIKADLAQYLKQHEQIVPSFLDTSGEVNLHITREPKYKKNKFLYLNKRKYPNAKCLNMSSAEIKINETEDWEQL